MASNPKGLRKAAVLLVQMGREDSARVLSQMRDSEVEELTAEIVRLSNVDGDLAGAVIDEFYDMLNARRFVREGGMDFAQSVLEATLGAERAKDMLERLSARSEEHTSELQSLAYLVCRLLLEKKKKIAITAAIVTSFIQHIKLLLDRN